MRARVVQVEHDTRAHVQLPADADLFDRAIREGEGGVFQRLDGTRVRQVDEDTRRAVDPLIVVADLAIQLQRHAKGLREQFATDGAQHHGP